MAKGMSVSSTASFGKLLISVFGIAIAAVAFALVYKAFGKSTEMRSKAAEDKLTAFKTWEFATERNAEGWSASMVPMNVENGKMNVQFTPKNQPIPMARAMEGRIETVQVSENMMQIGSAVPPSGEDMVVATRIGGGAGARPIRINSCNSGNLGIPMVYNDGVNVTLPKGAKKVKLNVAVKAEYSTTEDRVGKENKIRRRRVPQRFAMEVWYQVSGSKGLSVPLKYEGQADGAFREYAVQMPEIAGLTISCMQIRFTQMPQNANIMFDRIQLTADKGLCVTRQVKCVKAPCEPIIECPKPTCDPKPYGCRMDSTGREICLEPPKDYVPCQSSPTPTCDPRPIPCRIGLNGEKVCADPGPGYYPCRVVPTQACKERPACLDNPNSRMRCMMAEPAEGWCAPKPTGYVCPVSGYIDCMPGPNKTNSMCSTEFQTWAKENCPTFKGIAY